MGIQWILSSSLVFLGMTTIIFSKTSEATLFHSRPKLIHASPNKVEWCSQTDYPDLCNSMLTAMKRGNREQATNSAISATVLQINRAKQRIAALLGARGAQGKAELNQCLESYGSAIDNLNISLRNIKRKALPDLLNNLSAASADISTCGDSFVESGLHSPIGKSNALLKKLTSNTLALATAMKH